MPILSEDNRKRVWRNYMRENLESSSFNKVALRSAVDATDQWIEDNQAAYNNALPTGTGSFRSTASLQQKTLLFCFVAMERAGLFTGEA